jgi:hypothetical protein
VFFTSHAGQTIDAEVDPRSSHFARVPSELILMFADHLGVGDINALMRTSHSVNRILARYIYRRAKHIRSRNGRPYFLEAVDAGNIPAVNNFIEARASVNVCDTFEDSRPTSLHSCVARGDIAMAQLLLQNGANVYATNQYGITPLHQLLSTCHPNDTMMGVLLDAAADISQRATFHDLIYITISEGHTSLLKLLLDRCPGPTFLDEHGFLHWAAENGTAATVRRILEAGANIEASNDLGETALCLATKNENKDILGVLLQAGANIDC